MPLDASIYQNSNAPQPVAPQNPMDVAQKAMTLSTLGMQYQQAARQMQTQSAIQGAYMRNTDPTTGQLDKAGVLSELGKTAPMAAQQVSSQFAQADEAKAKAQAAQTDAAQKTLSFTVPAMHYLAGMTEDQRADAYPGVIKQLKATGVPIPNMPDQYDAGHFRQVYSMTDEIGSKMKDYLDNQKTASETAQAPAKLSTELYGSRSPVSTVADQYTKEDSVSMARKSQVAMNQMIDNYKHPSPQGDASLVLNAFKIKFPTAPDVNSLEELAKSQSASDTWKNMANKALEGGLDQPTKDNLMRDGVSTFRANVDGQRETQGKYQGIAQQQGLPSTGFLKEPAIDKTYGEASKIQDKIGPYVPPAERGGILASVNSGIYKMLGGNSNTANASADKTQSNSRYPAPGTSISADLVAQYATKHNMKLSDAQKTLKGLGYAVGR